MLISPVRVYDLLTALLEVDEEKGPHTALLITPAGQLLSHATLPEEEEDDEEEEEREADGEEEDGDGDGEGEGEGNGEGTSKAADDEEQEEEEEVDEPWLEGPERLRLLLGLASQWEEDASPRVECELGRLFLRPIALPEPEAAPSNAPVPHYPVPTINSFVLVLNGTSDTPWSELAAKADQFLSSW